MPTNNNKTNANESIYLDQTDSDIPAGNMKKVCAALGKNIRKARRERGFSTEEMAEFTALSTSYIGLLERGERSPSLKNLLRICELFGVTPDVFLYSDDISTKRSISVAESKNSSHRNKTQKLFMLTQSLNEQELDFLIDIVKGIRKMQKKNDDHIDVYYDLDGDDFNE